MQRAARRAQAGGQNVQAGKSVGGRRCIVSFIVCVLRLYSRGAIRLIRQLRLFRRLEGGRRPSLAAVKVLRELLPRRRRGPSLEVGEAAVAVAHEEQASEAEPLDAQSLCRTWVRMGRWWGGGGRARRRPGCKGKDSLSIRGAACAQIAHALCMLCRDLRLSKRASRVHRNELILPGSNRVCTRVSKQAVSK